MTNPDLYLKIIEHDFDADHQVDINKSFEAKLLINNFGWDPLYMARTILEYKRFIYLVIQHGKVAPSDAVDQVWHQHILYTSDYAEFCRKYAWRFLHHNPDRTDGASQDSFNTTRALYQIEFGEDPPKDIWESWGNFTRIDLSTNYVVPTKSFPSIIKLFLTYFKNLLS
jgi:hypothetical protein